MTKLRKLQKLPYFRIILLHYKFYFLKYLFIIIPGTIAGDILVKNTTEKVEKLSTKNNLLTSILLFVIVFNVYALFTRQLSYF